MIYFFVMPRVCLVGHSVPAMYKESSVCFTKKLDFSGILIYVGGEVSIFSGDSLFCLGRQNVHYRK